jgi:hypothetical protein
MNTQLIDSRRLTGANLFWEWPSAVIEVSADGPLEKLVEAWRAAAMRWLDAVGHPDEQICHRLFDGGASLVISAPIDALYSMCELNEVAWASALHAIGLGPAPDAAEEIPRLTRLFDEESACGACRCCGMTTRFRLGMGALPKSGWRSRCRG